MKQKPYHHFLEQFITHESMDQHFLTNDIIISQLIQELHSTPNDSIIELGAGVGSFACEIKDYDTLMLVELDDRLYHHLVELFESNKHIIVCKQNAIDVLRSNHATKIISNLPFFLTKEVLSILATRSFETAILATHKEDDLSEYNTLFNIKELMIATEDDFTPRQPFQTTFVKLTPYHAE